MKQIKVNNVLYVIDTEAYQITEDTDAGIIFVPEDSYADYIVLNPTLTLTKYNYNMFRVTTPEWDSPEPPTPTKESRLVITYNIESTAQPTRIYTFGAGQPVLGAVDFSDIEIDGTDVSVETIDNNGGGYQFASTGDHIVKYTLKGNSISEGRFSDNGDFPIKSLYIPSILTGFGQWDFGLSTCDTIIIDEDNPKYTSNGAIGNCIVDKTTNTLIYVSKYPIIPDNVVEIIESCGSYYEIENLVIPNSVTTIGDNAFSNCNSLTNLTIGSGVTTIGSGVFSDCENLSTVTIYGSNDLSYDLQLSYVTTLYVDSSMIQTYEDTKEDMGYEYTVLPIE